jgi:hypothetical protein
MSETYIPAALRREVIERAHGCCEYCYLSQATYPVTFSIDHLIAEKHGGQTVSHNLCLSCYWCNTYKGSDITSVDWASGGQIVPLYNPRQQTWKDHFRLQDALIQPLTGTGRVTVSLLRLNARERVEERELLLALDEYPCQ